MLETTRRARKSALVNLCFRCFFVGNAHQIYCKCRRSLKTEIQIKIQIKNGRIIALQYCVAFYYQFSSVAQSCLTLGDPMDCSTPGFPVCHQLQSLLKLMSIDSVMPSNHLILCCSLLLPSVFPSIRVFSCESVLRIRWPKY